MMENRAVVIKALEVAPGVTYMGSDTCYRCHPEYEYSGHNAHMDLVFFGMGVYKQGCEFCYGSGFEHVNAGGDPVKIISFGENSGLTSGELADTCTTCHQGGEMMHRAGSGHAFNEVSCVDCHDIHDSSGVGLFRDKGIVLCVSYYRNQKVKT